MKKEIVPYEPQPAARQPFSSSLFAIEEHLTALCDSEPDPENEKLHQEWLQELSESDTKARHKRDRVMTWILWCEHQIEFARAQKQRYTHLQQVMERKLERFRDQVTAIVLEHGERPTAEMSRGKHSRRLYGTAGYLSTQLKPVTVIVDEPKALPGEFISGVELQLSYPEWKRFHDALPTDELRAAFLESAKMSPDKRRIREHLKGENDLAGCKLESSGHTLTVR